MKLREINFSFAGKHCLRDFGCMYVESDGHVISPAVRRNEYTIAGMSGTVLMNGEVHEPFVMQGTLYLVQSPADQAAAQAALRTIVAWLRQGRAQLIFDYEPGKYYMAEVQSPTQWGYAGWIDGGLEIAFVCQPFAYNVVENAIMVEKTELNTGHVLQVATGYPAPLGIEIHNIGEAPIYSIQVITGTSGVTMLRTLVPGEALIISMEPPVAAMVGDELVLSDFRRFDHMEMVNGSNVIWAGTEFGPGTPRVMLTLRARGRY